MDGILCIDKPTGMTSFLCCAVVRRLLGVKKIGHAGTLDPNATGVLPLLVGKATKALELLPSHDKRYTATLRFGAVSDTLDIWGTVSETGQPLPTRAAIEAALPAFRGAIWQVPPMTSARHCRRPSRRKTLPRRSRARPKNAAPNAPCRKTPSG